LNQFSATYPSITREHMVGYALCKLWHHFYVDPILVSEVTQSVCHVFDLRPTEASDIVFEAKSLHSSAKFG